MTTIVSDGALESDHRDGGHRSSVATAWTDEQTAYALFLRNASVRVEVIGVEIGIEPSLVGDFVRDALVTLHHARHTQPRGRQGEAWIDAIARNLGRQRRWVAATRGRRRTIFRSPLPFARDHRHPRIYAEVQRLTSGVVPSATTM